MTPDVFGLKERPSICGLDIARHNILCGVARAHTTDGECYGEDADIDGDQPVATPLRTLVNRIDNILERHSDSPSHVFLRRGIEAPRR